ncbi:MAG: creatininase family protein, partial [Geminicoccaceae bacterium]
MLRLPGWWQDLASPEFRLLDGENTVAVLPVGAIEQHGPHLPVAVDTCLVDAVVGRAMDLLPAETPVLVLPTTAVGKSN